jgi:hypothetical protein
MNEPYPLRVFNDRPLPPDHRGPIFVWDVDQTYLDTDFKSLGGLLRIPLEMAIDKRSVPGVAAVLRECRHGPEERPRQTPIYFVSASPPELQGVIRRKMVQEGVQPDGFVFKDQLALALQRRFHALKHQVEYKLRAHLALLAVLPAAAELVVVGDDWESDARIFALLEAVLAGTLNAAGLDRLLRDAGVEPEAVPALAAALSDVAPGRRVALPIVLLTRGRDPVVIAGATPSVRTAREALQLALVLWEAGLISAAGVQRVAADLRYRSRFEPEAMHRSLDDAVARRLVTAERLGALDLGI